MLEVWYPDTRVFHYLARALAPSAGVESATTADSGRCGARLRKADNQP